jgi:hypothetical protein
MDGMRPVKFTGRPAELAAGAARVSGFLDFVLFIRNECEVKAAASRPQSMARRAILAEAPQGVAWLALPPSKLDVARYASGDGDLLDSHPWEEREGFLYSCP